MNFWLFTIKNQKYKGKEYSQEEIYNQRMQDKFWGIGERTSNRKYLKEDDKIVYYMLSPKRLFVGTAVLNSACYKLSDKDKINIGHGDEFYKPQFGVDLKCIEKWKEEQNVENIINDLEFIKNKDRWWDYFQGGIIKMSEEDYLAIIKNMDDNIVNQEYRAAIAWDYLLEIVLKKEKTTYIDLSSKIGVHHRTARFFLELIQNNCIESKLPPLTILVVNKSTGKPGGGFIAWDIDNIQDGFKKVYEYDWSKIENPFNYAKSGESKKSLAKKILGNPSIAKEIYTLVKSRGSIQPIFRQIILGAYENKCAICGLGIVDALESSHIIPWNESNEAERLDVRNGILLCATHHKLFENGYITVNNDYSMNCSIKENNLSNVSDYDNTMLLNFDKKSIILPKNISHYPNVRYLELHKNKWINKFK